MQKDKQKSLFLIFMIVSMIVWGVSWPVGKIVSAGAGGIVLVFWRFILSFAGIIGVLLFYKNSLKITPGQFGLLLLSGALLVVYNLFFFQGVKVGYAGAGGVVVTCTMPLFTFLLTAVFERQSFSGKSVAGLLLGLLGGMILLEIWNISFENLLKTGNLFFLLAALSWAVLTIISRKSQQKVHFVVYSFYAYSTASVMGLIMALITGEELLVVFSRDSVFWSGLFYLSILSVAFATTVYFLASKKLGSHRAGSFTFIVPSVALISSIFILGESPGWTTFAGGALAMTAVYLINSPGKKKVKKET